MHLGYGNIECVLNGEALCLLGRHALGYGNIECVLNGEALCLLGRHALGLWEYRVRAGWGGKACWDAMHLGCSDNIECVLNGESLYLLRRHLSCGWQILQVPVHLFQNSYKLVII